MKIEKCTGVFRFGFNGMEKDDEWKGNGNSYTTHFRQYDPRLGRWLSNDPKGFLQPNMSPYVGMNNNPIMLNDPQGDIAPVVWAAIVAAIEAGGQTAVDAVLGTVIGMLTGDPYTIWAGVGDYVTNLIPGWGELRTINKFKKIFKIVDKMHDAIHNTKAVRGLAKASDKVKSQLNTI